MEPTLFFDQEDEPDIGQVVGVATKEVPEVTQHF